MKEKIYPLGLLYFLTMILFLLISLISLYSTALCIYKLIMFNAYILIIPTIATLLSFSLFFYIFLCNIPNKIILSTDKIIVTGQKNKGKVQYREIVEYCKIRDIKLLCGCIDSQGHYLKNKGIASMRPHVFYEFILQDGSSKLVYIEIYSIRQRKKILKIINEKANLNLTYKHLQKIDYGI